MGGKKEINYYVPSCDPEEGAPMKLIVLAFQAALDSAAGKQPFRRNSRETQWAKTHAPWGNLSKGDVERANRVL